jgi:pimeloyl-ACP methyl ester carboxylesterase
MEAPLAKDTPMTARSSLLAVAALGLTAGVFAQDAVIFPDGYTVRGKVDKEKGAQQFAEVFSRSTAFDYANSGARFVFFSRHAKKGAQVLTGVQEEEKPQVFSRWYSWMNGSKSPLPAMGLKSVGEFNADWVRTVEIRSLEPGFRNVPPDKITQVVTYLSPTALKIDSSTHRWREVYDPKEFGPDAIRKLLATHPDVTDGWIPAPDPMRRLTIAQFMKQVGWLAAAREELARTKKDCPWAWPKEAADRFDKLTAEIDQAETRWVIEELKAAVSAGQYKLAASVLAGYQPKSADPKDLTEFADLKARVDEAVPRYEAARRWLRDLLDRESGAMVRKTHAAVGGGIAFDLGPKKPLTADLPALLDGGEAVYREVHPDTLGRIERFLVQVKQEEDRAKAGKEPDVTGDRLLALAVTGWLEGKNGAVQKPDRAAKVWRTRQLITAYLRADSGNDRATLYKTYASSSDSLQPDEFAQIVTLLPPIDPDDPANIRGKKVDAKEAGAPDVYKIDTGVLPDDSAGMTYYVRLPREYHHGRSYPVVLALNDPEFGAEKMVGLLAEQADRSGYVVASIEWAPRFGGKPFDHTGKDHRLIVSCIRDLSRKFQIDQDRVFAWGLSNGANFALDLSMSKPDLLAGVVCMGPFPVHQFYQNYWKNAQKCPVYCITGEMAGPSVDALRRIYECWLPLGFYSILSVYKGRGSEWFSAELPTLFDWMNRKTRVRGIGTLRQDGKRFEAWQVFRETDDRFYWVGATELGKSNKFVNGERPDRPPMPAEFVADIQSNEIKVLGVRGAKQITVWLEKDMIDWEKPLRVRVDGNVNGFKPQKMKPDVRLMLEELYRTGDRKMLFFGKLEFRTGG